MIASELAVASEPSSGERQFGPQSHKSRSRAPALQLGSRGRPKVFIISTENQIF